MILQENKGILSRLSSSISKFQTTSIHSPVEEAKAGFLKAQRLAYQCVVEVGKEIQEGWTEKQTAKRMSEYLKDNGVKTFFHTPFAWFGNHSRFDGYKSYKQYRPDIRKLKANDIIILDVSPIVDGYIGDIGYTMCLSPSKDLDSIMKYLLQLRELIPKLFASEKNVSEIWAEIDNNIKENGYDNCHAKYPFAVLGHRVYKVPLANYNFPLIPVWIASWFSFQAQYSFVRHGILPELLTPDHSGSKIGVWAIEPHIGGKGFGAKFEEILVVENDRAYWLDDKVPHVEKYNK
ncbi:MAG: aminopeptidase P family protein [Leptospira sp.]|nr:aminopeptidase P family protein [Leptospira sp.]